MEKSPFFVEKLAIQVLPTLVYFIDGIAVSRIIGFEGISDESDEFPTIMVSRALVNINAIDAKTKSEEGRTKINMKAGKHDNWSDSDEE